MTKSRACARCGLLHWGKWPPGSNIDDFWREVAEEYEKNGAE